MDNSALPLPVPTRARARALLFGAGVLFGLSAVLVKLASREAGMSGGQISLVRFLVGLGAVGALFASRPGTFRPVKKGLLFSRGLLGGVSALLYFLAISRIPAGEATLLNNTFPIWAVLISFFFLRERPTAHLALALLLASTGVFLVLGGGSVHIGLGVGEIAAIVSAVTGGAAITSVRALRATDNAPTIFFAMAVGGVVVSLPFAFGPWPSGGLPWIAALTCGLVAFVAQLLMTEAYGALPVPEAALWQQLTPIASYGWAFSVLGEQVSAFTVIGVSLGVVGVTYGAVLGHRPEANGSARAGETSAGIAGEDP